MTGEAEKMEITATKQEMNPEGKEAWEELTSYINVEAAARIHESLKELSEEFDIEKAARIAKDIMLSAQVSKLDDRAKILKQDAVQSNKITVGPKATKKNVIEALRVANNTIEALAADIEGVRHAAREYRGLAGAEDMSATAIMTLQMVLYDADMREMRGKVQQVLSLSDLQTTNLSNSPSIAVEEPLKRLRILFDKMRVVAQMIEFVIKGVGDAELKPGEEDRLLRMIHFVMAESAEKHGGRPLFME